MKNRVQQCLNKIGNVEKAPEKSENLSEETKQANILLRKKRQIVPAEKTESEEEAPEKPDEQPKETRKAKKSRKKRQLVSSIRSFNNFFILGFILIDKH